MTLHVGFLVFPNVQQLDVAAPYEVFASAPEVKVHLTWKNQAPVVSATGLPLTPTTTFAHCPALDVLCVPGGVGVNVLLEDGETLAFVRACAERARYVTAVCTGSLVLGAAGLLRGKRATTHWFSHDFLERFGAVAVHERVVRDGSLITAGGVTAGIDFALTVLADLLGREQAEAVQLALEYAPAPPFQAGDPVSAPPAAVAIAKARMSASRAAREAIIERLEQRAS
jgi:cyclohexyl-isocyanide hydratase